MSGWITEEIQAAAPGIADAIDGAGQNVIIRRPGQPDAIARAFLHQLDDGDRQGRVNDPQLKVMAWQGFFKPDAPLTLPFTVIDQQGQVFIPDGPPQDAGHQGVLIVVHLLPLTERTRVEHLTFTLPGPLGKDKSGNPVPTPGPKLTAPTRLVASQDPRIRDMAGADTADVVLVGRWGTLERPTLKPDGLKWGMTSPLVLDGQNGTLTLKVAYPDPDLAQEMQFGARFVAAWRANS